jgi:hypothetical protein
MFLSTLCVVVYLAASALSVLAFLGLITDQERFAFWSRPGAAVTLTAVGVLGFVGALPFLASLSVLGVILILPLFGVVALPVYVFAGGVADGFATLGAGSITLRRESDRARAAIAREDWDAAERFYREDMTGDPARDCLLHLGLGTLHRRRGRHREAAAAWRAALAEGLAPEEYAATALRLADLLRADLQDPAAARAVLAEAVERHPHLPETTALRKRLAALGGAPPDRGLQADEES